MCQRHYSEMSENGSGFNNVTTAANLSQGSSRKVFPEVEPYL